MNFFPINISHKFICFNCNVLTVGPKGFFTSRKDEEELEQENSFISFYCINCYFINVFIFEIERNYDGDEITLSKINKYDGFKVKKYWKKIPNLEKNLLRIYDQILKAANNEMWEVVIILTRIIIMHIAKENKYKKENSNFYEYIEFLKEKNFLNSKFVELLNFTKEWENSLNYEIEKFDEKEKEKNKKIGEICLSIVINTLENLYGFNYFESDEKMKN